MHHNVQFSFFFGGVELTHYCVTFSVTCMKINTVYEICLDTIIDTLDFGIIWFWTRCGGEIGLASYDLNFERILRQMNWF